MANNLGRISGPLLKPKLVRDGIDLQIQNAEADTTAILYVDVTNGRLGVSNNTPTRELDVTGTTRTTNLEVDQTILTTNITSPSGESLTISPGAGGTVQILGFEVSNTAVNFDVDEIVFNNLKIDGDGDATTIEAISSNTDLYINSAGTGRIYANGIDLLLGEGETYWVTKNGSDSNNGLTENQAFATLKYALAQAQTVVDASDPAPTIHLGAGTFEETAPLALPKGVSIVGRGIRSTQLKPTADTRTKDFFAMNGETTIENLTIREIEFDSAGNPEIDLSTENSFAITGAANNDKVGFSVAVGSNKIVVGARGVSSELGSASIFDLNGTNEIVITASDGVAGDAFGDKVAVGDNKVAVASPNKTSFRGTVYLYNTDGTNEIIVNSSDGGASNFFGADLAIGSNKLVVGTDGPNKVYTYNLIGTNEQIITPPDSTSDFGKSVAIGEGYIVVGAPGDSSQGSNTGAVYVFTDAGVYQTKIFASDAAGSDFFGSSVSIGNGKIAVGAYGENGGTGAVYIYDLDGSNEVKITPSDGAVGDRFGWSLDIENERVIVSSYQDNSSTGSIYTYTLAGKIELKYEATDGVADDDFGFSIAAAQETVVVGAPGGVNTVPGKVYTYDFVGQGSGYAVCYSPDAVISTRSAYLKNVTILNFGSSVRLGTNAADDPYGFDAGDAGRGIIVDGSKIADGSLEAAMLFSDITIMAPNSKGLVLTDGARAEWLNSFVYFAEQGIEANAGTKGKFNNGKTYLDLEGITGTFNPGDTITYTADDGVTVVAEAEIESVDGNTIAIDGRADGFKTSSTRPTKVLTASGDAQLDTVVKKFGTASLELDGTGDKIVVTSSTDFGYGTNDFTIEFWLYLSATGAEQVVWDQRATTDNEAAPTIRVNSSNQLVYSTENTDQITGVTTLSGSTWYHVAVSRDSSATRLFLDGVQQGSGYIDNTDYIASPITIGSKYDDTTNLTGFIDEVRISSIGRYVSPFTPLNQEFLGDESTVMLVHFNGTSGSTTFTDDITQALDISSSSGGTATGITRYDRKDFGAELRSIASANVYGIAGVKANGPDVRLRLSSHDFGYIGAEKDLTNNDALVNQANEITETNGGKVFYNSTDQFGDYRIGDLFIVDQETGAVTFTGGQFDVTSLTGINFTDGVNSTIIDPTQVTTGNITISGNTIDNPVTDIEILSDTLFNTNVTINQTATVNGATQVNNTLDVTGQTTVASLAVQNLTVDRILVADTNGQVGDDANLTWNSSLLNVNGNIYANNIEAGQTATLASAKISDLTSGRVVLAGTDGELEDSLNLTFNGTELSVGAGNFTVQQATGNTQVIGTLDVDSTATLASAVVEDLTATRIPYVTTGSAIVDTADMTYDGTDVILASAKISDLTDNRVIISGADGSLEDDANFTYDGTTLTVNDLTFTGNTISHTGGDTETIVLDANVQINGTTTTVNSTTITVDDPVLVLGGDTLPTADDNKDRGVEFRWHDGLGPKTGFFGYDDSAEEFTFIPDATNAAEVFSGGRGRVHVGTLQADDLTSTRVVFSGTNGVLKDSATFTFNDTTGLLTIDGDLTVTGTFSQSAQGGGSNFNSLQIDDLFFDDNAITISTSGTDLDINLFNGQFMNVGGNLSVAGDIEPYRGDTYNLGTQEKSFNNLYLGEYRLSVEAGYLSQRQFQNLLISNNGDSGFVEFDITGALGVPVGTTAERPKIATATPTTYSITVGFDLGEGSMTVAGDFTGLNSINLNVGDTINILNTTGETLYVKTEDSIGATGAISGPYITNNGAANNTTIIIDATIPFTDNGTVFVKMAVTETPGFTLSAAEAFVNGKTGQIRFNTTDSRFEGYNGISWSTLGGVSDVDGNTRIDAETAPGDDNNQLEFYTNGVRRATLDDAGLTIQTEAGNSAVGMNLDGNTISTTELNADLTLSPNGTGNVIIAGDLQVQGTTIQVDSTVVTVADPILELGSGGLADGLDRGLKLTYNSGGVKAAFIGLDDSSAEKEFVYIADATDTSSVFSGALGQAAFGSLRVTDLTADSIPYITSAAAGDQDNQLKTAANFLFDGTTFSIGDAQEFSVDASTGVLTTTTSINTALTDNSVVFITGGGNLGEDSNFTWDGSALNITGNISMTGDVVPTVDSDGITGYDLGAANARWRDLYLSGGSLFLNELRIGQDPATGGMQIETADGGPVDMIAHRMEGTEGQFGDVEIIGNTISTLSTNGDIILATQGTGIVQVPGDLRVTGTIIVDNVDTDEVTFNVTLVAPDAQFDDIKIAGNVIETTQTNSDLTLRAPAGGIISMPTNNVDIRDSLSIGAVFENPVLRIDRNTITTLDTNFDLELTAFGGMEVSVPFNDLRVDQTIKAFNFNSKEKLFIGESRDDALKAVISTDQDTVIEARLGSDLVLNSITGTVEIPTTDVNLGENLNVDGNASVTGLNTLGSVTIPSIPQNRIVYTDNAGLFTSDENFRMFGTTVDFGNGNVTIGAGNGNIYASNNVTIDGELDVNTKIRAATLNIENIREDMIPFVDVTGQIVGNRGFTYEEDIAKLTVPNLEVDELTFTSNVISTNDTNGDIVLDPQATGLVIIQSDQSLQIPVGNVTVRPTGAAGQIRFNTDTSQYEGYTNQWTPLGGVRDADNDTFILPESSPGTDEDTITMTIQNVERFALTGTDLTTTGVNWKNGSLIITDETIGSEVNQDIIITSNGTGKVDIQGTSLISGNLTIGNEVADTVIFTAGVASDFLPDQDGVRNLGSALLSWNDLHLDGTATINIATLTSVDINGGNIDNTIIGATTREAAYFTTIAANGQVSLTGNIGSVDSTTGTLVVTGGTGISENLFVNGTSNFTGLVTADNVTATGNVNLNGADITLSLQPTGTGTVTINPDAVGEINNMNIGAATRGTGAFTTLTANDAVTLTANTTSTNSTNGTLVVTGGVGVSENVNLGGSLTVGVDATITGDLDVSGAATINPANNSISLQPTGTGTVTINPGTVGTIDRMNIGATNRGTGAFTTLSATGLTEVTDTTSSTLTTNGAFVVAGGVGIAENLNVGGDINAAAATFTGAINLSPADSNVTISPTGVGEVIVQPVGGLTINPTAIGTIDNVNIGGNTPGDAVFNDVTIQGVAEVTDTTQSDNPDQGAFIVRGGVGIYKNLHVGQYAEIDNGILVRGNTGTNSDFYTNIRTDDKILTVGGVVPPSAATSEDRGVEFRWHDGANDKTGFFGYQDSTGYFVFKPDGTNTGDVYTGDTGTINANFLGAVTSTNAIITGGSIDGTPIGQTTTADATVNNFVADGNVTLGEDNTKLLTINAKLDTNIIPNVDNTYDLGANGAAFRNIFADGTATINTISVLNADIDGGAIDGTTIGATTPSSGAFTSLSANQDVTITSNTSSTTTTTGALTITGGLGVGENVNAAGKGTFVGLESTGTVTLDPVNLSVSLQPTGLGTVTVGPGTTGTIDNMNIGSATRGTGAFTTLEANDQVTFNSGVNSTATNNGALVVSGGIGISDNLNVGGNAIITGNLTVNGTTTTVNSTTVTVDDPIITLAGDTAPTLNDGKDRGVEFRYYGTEVEPSKIGFMGWNNSSGKFTMLLNATNQSEQFSGDIATLQANLEGNILSNSASINSGFINNTEIGTTTPNLGVFTDLTANDDVVLGSSNLDTVTFNAYVGSAIIPQGAGLNFGNLTNQWNDMYLEGTANINIANITSVDINGGSVDAITLGTNSAVTEAQIDNININGNTISATDIDGSVVLTPNGEGVVEVNSTKAIRVAVGTEAEKPVGSVGDVRFNTTTEQFEGYVGAVWTTLGGVRDADGDTTILPELTPGSNEDRFYFYAGGVEIATLDATEGLTLNFGSVTAAEFDITGTALSTTTSDADLLLSPNGTGSVIITSTNGSSAFENGALIVRGGAGIGQNLNVGNDLVVLGDTTLGDDPANDRLVVGSSVEINMPDNAFNNVFTIQTLNTDSTVDKYIDIDTLNGFEKIIFGTAPNIIIENTTQSSSTTSGALTVAGGIGVAGNLNVGGNFILNGDFVTDDNMIKLNNSAIDANDDVGFYSKYNDGLIRYKGLFADASTGKFRLFQDTIEEPSGEVNITATGYAVADLVANIEGGSVSNLTSAIGVADGGTGKQTHTNKGILYGNGTDPIGASPAAGTADQTSSSQLLTVDGTGSPVWTDTIDGGTF